ncbi:hypothetical protein ID866_10946 [Astraeus odoratus]|nr:hypothetical protein ID866_10946 [Astraeus odoratus]
MASQQPAHWNRCKLLTANHSPPSTVTSTAPGTNTQVVTATPTAVPPPAALATTAAVFCPTWGSDLEDLACPAFSTVGSPSPIVLNSLTRPSLMGNSLLDSGTSWMLMCDHVYFHSYQEGGGVNMHTANHGTLPTAGAGDCMAYLTVGESCYCVHFTGCLHALDAALSLISVGYMLSKGWECNFRGDPPHCNLVYHSRSLGKVPLVENLCFLPLKFIPFDAPLPLTISPWVSAFAQVPLTHDLWHARIGHVGGEAAKHLPGIADGVTTTSTLPLSVCESCIVAKHACKPFHTSETEQALAFLDLMHADLAGPMPVAAPHGKHYFMVVLDDHTHVLDLHLLSTKDQALKAWEITHHHWETKAGTKVKAFQSDNGGEFPSQAFTDALNTCGISHCLSVPYMHQQNGTAERVIHTVEG